MASAAKLLDVGGVVIGRNEGVRLEQCLNSLSTQVERIVYVDSGSTDGSVAMARSKGVEVVELDMTRPFTAARARNEGLRRLLTSLSSDAYVQFVDGDCEVQPNWLERAKSGLDANPKVAAVFGRRRERFPERSIYNRLCDMEWASAAVGETKYCGGDVMIRASALRQVGGYRDDLIAGEEPELCVRLREKGWTIEGLSAEMTLHDAAMTRLGQWWMRNVRSGYAFAEGASLHGAPPERHWVREFRRSLNWGVIAPLLILAAMLAIGPWAAAALLIYPLQIARIFLQNQRKTRNDLLRAAFLVIGRFPEAQGAARFWRLRMMRRGGALIEYK